MKKINYPQLLSFLILLIVPLFSYSQDLRSKRNVDSTELNIRNLQSLSGVYEYQEPDFLRSHTVDSTSTLSSKTVANDSGMVMKKIIRLDPNEVKNIFPEATYQYPSGQVVVDYDALVAILMVAYQQDQKAIKELQKKVSDLETVAKSQQ